MRICIPVALSLFAFACSSRVPVSALSEVCSGAGSDGVQIEGYLRLPMSSELFSTSTGDGRPSLILVENQNGTGSFVTVFAPETTRSEPNHMAKLPARFTFDDLRIYANSGKELESRELVRLTGRVTNAQNGCSVEIETIDVAGEL